LAQVLLKIKDATIYSWIFISAMKASTVATLILAASIVGTSGQSPISKVVQLLSDLETKITAEGAAAVKTYDEFSAWCQERSANLGFEIKTGKSEVAELSASITKDTSTIEALTNKIEELVAGIATDDADLKAATEIRDKEGADFAAEEKELAEVISMLERAVGILQKEMRKGGASMMQLKNAGSIASALNVMVEASVMSSADAKRLTALVQSSQASASDADDAELGAPAAAVYQGHSGDIIDTLEDILEKAESQLADARKKESSALHNFQMLKQSLEDEIKFANKDMAGAKTGVATAGENKAGSESNLAMTSKELDTDTTTLAGLKDLCLQKSQDHEAGVKSRAEELKALAQAKKVITEQTGGAASISYGLAQVSFVQLVSRSGLASGTDLANFEAVRLVRDLARKQHSPALAQLASRMAAAMQMATNSGADPFAKVKGLIGDMIERLESEAGADATHKAYCDKELGETKVKQSDKNAEIDKLSSSIDKMESRSAQLKEEVASTQKALAELAASAAEMSQLRSAEHEEYVSSKADMEQGLQGVKLGLKILREYYASDGKAHAAAEGAGQGIIGLLEVVESDFSKGLAEIMTTEDSSADAFDKASKANAIEKASKEADVKYKAKESSGLDKAVADASSDRSGVQAELDAVLEYLASLEKQCIAKPETYGARKGRREAELAGLKEALSILEGEAMLLQSEAKRSLRGIHLH